MANDYPVIENSGVKADIVSAFFVVLLIGLALGGYHYFIASPAIGKAKIYYVVDLDALMNTKAEQLLERERNTPGGIAQETLLAEANAFRAVLGDDLLHFSDGHPVFQKGTVVRADKNVVDLTPVLMEHYELE